MGSCAVIVMMGAGKLVQICINLPNL